MKKIEKEKILMEQRATILELLKEVKKLKEEIKKNEENQKNEILNTKPPNLSESISDLEGESKSLNDKTEGENFNQLKIKNDEFKLIISDKEEQIIDLKKKIEELDIELEGHKDTITKLKKYKNTIHALTDRNKQLSLEKQRIASVLLIKDRELKNSLEENKLLLEKTSHNLQY